MTEVANLNGTDNKLVVERHYEAGPPEGLVETGDTIAITKEEEWTSKKTTEVTNTKQIETRVKRQVVLEDGKVVEDSGPVVTTNTTEDKETQQHRQTELKKLGDDEEKEKKALEDGEKGEADDSKWVVVPNPDGTVREVNERRVISREEIENVKETEDVHHLGDITDEAYIAAVNSGTSDLRPILKADNNALVSTGPKIIKETHRSKKITDTEETKAQSSILPDGRIVTETQKTTEHEEVKDDELPEGAPDQNQHKESHQRFFKSRDQEEVDYVADGVKVGHEMRFRGETSEAERRGDGIDDPNWESLSTRAKRRQTLQSRQRLKAVENGIIPSASPLDRKDALTKKPLDFDKEEETRKHETSKWLEHHFGSESRSSRDSLDDLEDEPQQKKETKTSFFNVTIKSQPTPQAEFTSTRMQPLDDPQKYHKPTEIAHITNGYHTRQVKHFQGVKEWSERERDAYKSQEILSSPVPHREPSPVNYSAKERYQRSPPRDYQISPSSEISPTTPPRRRLQDRPQKLIRDEVSRFDSGYRTLSRNELDREPLEEPPPDYSPTSPPRVVTPNKKLYQKTRFATDASPPPSQVQPTTKVKSGNIIGQSIRKLVGKIRSASAERKAKQQQRAKRSPSPTYKQGNIIDNLNESQNGSSMQNGSSRRSGSPGPVHRYYLGEDPFGGSIYGRENKYDGVRPARPSRRHESRYNQEPEEYRSHSTLGRFSKASSRLGSTSTTEQRNSQTLPRQLNKHEKPIRLEKSDKSNSTINVSIINTVSTSNKPIVNGGPAKPARTYKSNLLRSKSFNVDLDSPQVGMSKFSPQLRAQTGLKSPGLISSISRSQRDLTVEQTENGNEYKSTSRFSRNGGSDNKRIFLKDLRQRAPELYKTLHEEEKDDSWRPPLAYSTPLKTSRNHYNGDIYEPPTRLRESPTFKETYAPSGVTKSIIRRGSNSSNDYSETYHTTTRNGNSVRPTITNTVQSFSKKTVPTKDGRNYQTIESTETKSITKSRYNGDRGANQVKFYENDYKLNNAVRGPVVIEVRNNYK